MDGIADCDNEYDCVESNGELCELEVTVCTGFETTAKEEIEETINSACDVTASRGCVNMFIPLNDTKKVNAVSNVKILQ